jgi:hypothetical protein
MNYELESMWKEVVVAEPTYWASIFFEDLRRAMKNLGLAAVPVKIRTNTARV